jgi:hypothetical protein
MTRPKAKHTCSFRSPPTLEQIPLHGFRGQSGRETLRPERSGQRHYSTSVNTCVGFLRRELDPSRIPCYPLSMPKRSSRKRGKQGPEDVNEVAFRVTQEAIGEGSATPSREKNPAAVALGRLGGKKGGKARAAKLTPRQRSEIASLAAQARWKKADR